MATNSLWVSTGKQKIGCLRVHNDFKRGVVANHTHYTYIYIISLDAILDENLLLLRLYTKQYNYRGIDFEGKYILYIYREMYKRRYRPDYTEYGLV